MEETGGGSNEDLKTMTLEELNTLLNDVLESEDYIRAIAIRDEINNRKKKWTTIYLIKRIYEEIGIPVSFFVTYFYKEVSIFHP